MKCDFMKLLFNICCLNEFLLDPKYFHIQNIDDKRIY